MVSTSNPAPVRNAGRVLAMAAMAAILLAPMFLNGCMMTPEDKAFYGRGWINPDELDQDDAPPRNFQDPTAIPPRMMGPGNY